MGIFDESKQWAETAAKDHPDQIEKASDEALGHGGDTADRATGGKHTDQIDKAEHTADDKVGD